MIAFSRLSSQGRNNILDLVCHYLRRLFPEPNRILLFAKFGPFGCYKSNREVNVSSFIQKSLNKIWSKFKLWKTKTQVWSQNRFSCLFCCLFYLYYFVLVFRLQFQTLRVAFSTIHPSTKVLCIFVFLFLHLTQYLLSEIWDQIMSLIRKNW